MAKRKIKLDKEILVSPKAKMLCDVYTMWLDISQNDELEIYERMKAARIAAEEMKNILQQISSVDGFPLNTTIKTETFGKSRTKYIFT